MFLQRIHKMHAYLLVNSCKFMQICISLAVFIQYALSISIRMTNRRGTRAAMMLAESASLESV